MKRYLCQNNLLICKFNFGFLQICFDAKLKVHIFHQKKTNEFIRIRKINSINFTSGTLLQKKGWFIFQIPPF